MQRGARIVERRSPAGTAIPHGSAARSSDALVPVPAPIPETSGAPRADRRSMPRDTASTAGVAPASAHPSGIASPIRPWRGDAEPWPRSRCMPSPALRPRGADSERTGHDPRDPGCDRRRIPAWPKPRHRRNPAPPRQGGFPVQDAEAAAACANLRGVTFALRSRTLGECAGRHPPRCGRRPDSRTRDPGRGRHAPRAMAAVRGRLATAPAAASAPGPGSRS